jgi:hypothetical protein
MSKEAWKITNQSPNFYSFLILVIKIHIQIITDSNKKEPKKKCIKHANTKERNENKALPNLQTC